MHAKINKKYKQVKKMVWGRIRPRTLWFTDLEQNHYAKQTLM